MMLINYNNYCNDKVQDDSLKKGDLKIINVPQII